MGNKSQFFGYQEDQEEEEDGQVPVKIGANKFNRSGSVQNKSAHLYEPIMGEAF